MALFFDGVGLTTSSSSSSTSLFAFSTGWRFLFLLFAEVGLSEMVLLLLLLLLLPPLLPFPSPPAAAREDEAAPAGFAGVTLPPAGLPKNFRISILCELGEGEGKGVSVGIL